ncbi:MAG: hypothetical protein ABFS24_02140 [Pseudomonadota bacterium]
MQSLVVLFAWMMVVGTQARAGVSPDSLGSDSYAADGELEYYSLPSFQPQYPFLAQMLARTDSEETTADSLEGEAKKGQYTQAQINEMVNNPLGELWLLLGMRPCWRLTR